MLVRHGGEDTPTKHSPRLGDDTGAGPGTSAAGAEAALGEALQRDAKAGSLLEGASTTTHRSPTTASRTMRRSSGQLRKPSLGGAKRMGGDSGHRCVEWAHEQASRQRFTDPVARLERHLALFRRPRGGCSTDGWPERRYRWPSSGCQGCNEPRQTPSPSSTIATTASI